MTDKLETEERNGRSYIRDQGLAWTNHAILGCDIVITPFNLIVMDIFNSRQKNIYFSFHVMKEEKILKYLITCIKIENYF